MRRLLALVPLMLVLGACNNSTISPCNVVALDLLHHMGRVESALWRAASEPASLAEAVSLAGVLDGKLNEARLPGAPRATVADQVEAIRNQVTALQRAASGRPLTPDQARHAALRVRSAIDGGTRAILEGCALRE